MENITIGKTNNTSFIKTDVTAVLLFGDLIFAGIGSWIHVFDKKSIRLLHKQQTLKSQNIYGLRPSHKQSEILVYGGKQFTVVTVYSVSHEELLTPQFEPIFCDDWLSAGVWLNEVDVAVLTAHNVVQIWNKESESLVSVHPSVINPILYSGCLIPLLDSILVLSGTVYSEVVIWTPGEEGPLQTLKGHKGVIFSIACDLEKQLIVTNSDDRSVRIWGVYNAPPHFPNTKEFWRLASLECKHEVYGHTARVMRSIITSDLVISVGEDAAICFWDLKGKLLRKKISHQNGSIWCLDADSQNLLTGGGDSGVILHPLADGYEDNKVLNIEARNPKNIVFTTRRNIIVLDQDDGLYYYDTELKITVGKYKLNHESTYKLLSISSCKQIVAVVDMAGNLDIFIENCKAEPALRNIGTTKLAFNDILSMHWAGNRQLVFCGKNGDIHVLATKGNETEVVETFTLPVCKERWLTAAAVDHMNRRYALGDRCGNVHIYVNGQALPLKTFTKVHGRYGPTSIILKLNEMVTTGRDGTIKYFALNNSNLKFMSGKDLNFDWVEKFLDRDENIVCGFQERDFVVYDVKNSCRLFEIPCGGGHRTWDAVRYWEKTNGFYDEFIRFIYRKNSAIQVTTVPLTKVVSKNVTNCYHTKEINCLKSHIIPNKGITFYLSGGEDTTLRISSQTHFDSKFRDDKVFRHLSSVRTLKMHILDENKLLLVTAGGRAQICVKIVEFLTIGDEIKVETEEVIDYQIKGSDRDRKGPRSWTNQTVDFDPETRIMDVDILRLNDREFMIPAGCSDASLRIYKFVFDPSECNSFQLVDEVKHHKTCILKTYCFKFRARNILITCTTRGDVAFWHSADNTGKLYDSEPLLTTQSNKSGINSISVKVLSDRDIILATGGDDNAIQLTHLTLDDEFNVVNRSICVENYHCSEVTGIQFVDEDLLLSASIDQRVTLCKWRRSNDGISCGFLSQTYTDVADVQGFDVVGNCSDRVTVCVFGKGIQVLEIQKLSEKRKT